MWSGLLLLHTTLYLCPHQAGAYPARHGEPILLTQPNCLWPRTLTHTDLSMSHLSLHLLCIPTQRGVVSGPQGSKAASQRWPSSTLRPRQKPDQIFDRKSCPSESQNPWTSTGMAGPKGCVHSPRDSCRYDMMNTHLAMFPIRAASANTGTISF